MLDPPLSMGGPRERERLSDSVSDGRKERRRDTLLLVSAVCYPEDYDWQRDTAYGRVPCSVKLFSGKREVLSVPAGPGTGVGASID
ncbi:MAG: hypothetical protein IK031_06145, partial [Bacteroidales bacterium]|nr:hypothetical protein [Bacteroidales bacterium]